MADLTRTQDQISLVYPTRSVVFNMVAAVNLTAGQPVYEDANGRAAVADASAAPTAGVRGIALHKAAAGNGVSVLRRGHLYGYGVSGLAYGASAYLSDTAGELADAAGTVSVVLGKVEALADDPTRTKVLHIDRVGAA